MARLHALLDSDDELPELSTILRPQSDAINRARAKTPTEKHCKMPSQREETQNMVSEDSLKEKTCSYVKDPH